MIVEDFCCSTTTILHDHECRPRTEPDGAGLTLGIADDPVIAAGDRFLIVQKTPAR
jgi:hypothetical protein